MSIHYEDATVTLHHGDCLDVLRALPDASVDAVVTDPPYAINFMGRSWDSFKGTPIGACEECGNDDPTEGYRLCSDCLERADEADLRDEPMLGQQSQNWHAKATHSRGYADNNNAAFQRWCLLWSRECLRVLKPGGHLLAFGGTRTWHRLACAVEDAGFEVRDSIAWMYGSGFPKSLDVSKAIDKARGDGPSTLAVTVWLRDQVKAAGLTRAEVMLRGGFTEGQLVHWLAGTPTVGPGVPAWEQWEELRRVIGFGSDMDAEVWRLNGRKGQPGEAWSQREFLGTSASKSGIGNESSGHYTVGGTIAQHYDITAPATPDAERWQGWGTAMKPAHEPVVCARKPFADVDILARIGSQLGALEDACRQHASNAAKSSGPTHHASPEGKTASAPESAATPHGGEPARITPTGGAGGSSAATATSASASTAKTLSNTVTSWRACWAELCEAASTSTTSTATSRTTDLQTLSSCLSKIMQGDTETSTLAPDSWSSLASAVDNLFAAGVLNWRSTLALSAIESATDATPQDSLDAGGNAAFEPVVVARKPLIGTVAANVLAHGTGALNVDGCRVENAEYDPAKIQRQSAPTSGMMGLGASGWNSDHEQPTYNPAGRWPANVVLDESQARELDLMSGESASRSISGPVGRRPRGMGETGERNGDPTPNSPGHDDQGGASRFFYVAKADASERVRVNGTAHPTVKPLALMRWLVRLVTPPGGTVLEPFAGSGTTVEACILEGFQCIAIEREADYLPLIVQRINRRRDPVAAVLAADPDDGGLFDLLA